MAIDKETKERRAVAADELNALVKLKGSLKIITAEVHPDHRHDKKDPRSPAKDGVDLTDPQSFVLHDVTKIEEHPTKDGAYVASTDEGDWMMGYPDHLVVRLRDWRR